MTIIDDIWDWVMDNKQIALVVVIIALLAITQAPGLFQTEQAIFGSTSSSPIRPVSLKVSPLTPTPGDTVHIDVRFKNHGTNRHTINAEATIIADTLADRWGLPLALGPVLKPITPCGGEDFADATRISVDPGQEVNYRFTVKAPGPATRTIGGDSNWDGSHTVVIGMYSNCGSYLYAQTRDITITESGQSIKCTVGNTKDYRCVGNTVFWDLCRQFSGGTDWFQASSVCQSGTQCSEGICSTTPGTSLTCPSGFHLEGSDCIRDTVTCSLGQHEEDGVCVDDVGRDDTAKSVFEQYKVPILVILGLAGLMLVLLIVMLVLGRRGKR